MKQPQGMPALDNAVKSSALIKTPKWTVSQAKTPVYLLKTKSSSCVLERTLVGVEFANRDEL